MNYTDALLPYLMGSQPLAQTQWPPPPQLPSGVNFGMMSAPIDNATTESHHRPLVWHGPGGTVDSPMAASLSYLDKREADLMNARARQQSPMAQGVGINDITPLTKQGFGTTADGNIYFTY